MASQLVFNPADVKRHSDMGKTTIIMQMHINIDDEGNPIVYDEMGSLRIKCSIAGTSKIPNLGIGPGKDIELTEEFNKIKQRIVEKYFPSFEKYKLDTKFMLPSAFEREYDNTTTIAFMITLEPVQKETETESDETVCHKIELVSDVHQVICTYLESGISWFRFNMPQKPSSHITKKTAVKKGDDYLGEVGIEYKKAEQRKAA